MRSEHLEIKKQNLITKANKIIISNISSQSEKLIMGEKKEEDSNLQIN
jgi:uncharacterized protein YrrD